MKLEIHKSTPKLAGHWLLPVAWLSIGVILPAVLIWTGAADSSPTAMQAATDLHLRQKLQHQRALEQEWLETYGWVDREKGLVRIPIEEGMRAVLREGLPTRESSEEQR